MPHTHHRTTLLCLMTILLAGHLAAADGDSPVIVSISLKRAHNDYWKTAKVESFLKMKRDGYARQMQPDRKKRQELLQTLNELQEKNDNPALSREARKENLMQMRALYGRARDLERRLQETEEKWERFEQKERKELFDELHGVIKEFAADREYDMVLNSTALGLMPPDLLYASDKVDVTGEFLEYANRNHGDAALEDGEDGEDDEDGEDGEDGEDDEGDGDGATD